MNECNFIETTNTHSNLRDQIKFRLSEIIEIKDYFNWEFWQRKIMSKKLGEYIAAFDYFDKTLIVLSVTSGGISIISVTSVIEVPVGITSASFILVFCLTSGIIKNLLSIARNKKT